MIEGDATDSCGPDRVLVYVGGNAWRNRRVTAAEAEGKWAQIVYQVDDSPRYGALAAWSHDRGVSQWEPPAEWRPLPRRDATNRDDYNAIDGVNRHAITPFGGVHEQENSKLILTGGEPRVLEREIGVNGYRRSDGVDARVAEREEDIPQGLYLAAVEARLHRHRPAA